VVKKGPGSMAPERPTINAVANKAVTDNSLRSSFSQLKGKSRLAGNANYPTEAAYLQYGSVNLADRRPGELVLAVDQAGQTTGAHPRGLTPVFYRQDVGFILAIMAE